MADLEERPTLWIKIPLDGETARRLLNLSDLCHAEAEKVAASLLHDILEDDEQANLPTALAAGSVAIN
jgi:hypothetical protein